MGDFNWQYFQVLLLNLNFMFWFKFYLSNVALVALANNQYLSYGLTWNKRKSIT